VVRLKGKCRDRHLKFVSVALFFGLMGLSLAGCMPYIKAPPREKAMQRISSFAYPAFSDDLDYESLAYSISQSLAYLQKIPPDRIFVFGEDRFDTADMIRSLEVFQEYIQNNPSGSELGDFIRSNYRIYRAAGRDGRGEVLYTGYYEPHLQGCLHKSPECRFPIYARPNDLITIDLSPFAEKYEGEQIIGRYTDETVVPYYDRKEIDNDGALEDKAEVIAWVKDSVDIFFLQIQGSGKVYLDNGQVINVHYHTTNGRPYRSIGKLLIDEEKIPADQMSMQKIRAYLQEHPEEVETVLNYNPSYVFFKTEPDGPLGNINVKLTPGRFY
jgi:membrane-bound lytic murein transglycosylase A